MQKRQPEFRLAAGRYAPVIEMPRAYHLRRTLSRKILPRRFRQNLLPRFIQPDACIFPSTVLPCNCQYQHLPRSCAAQTAKWRQIMSYPKTGEEVYVSLNLSGVYPNHTEVEVVKLFEGRFINEIDIKKRRKVIVLHKKTAEILFNKTHTEPIGQFVNAGNVVYQVVGLYNDKGDSGDSDAYIPFTTLQTIYNKGDKLNNLVMTTKNLETVEANEAFEAHYRKVLGANHRFDPTDHSAIWIWNRFTNYLQQQKGSGMLRIAIWVIGIFTLLSGIVGVSNIMLITVKERTREFGIRKALGAKPLSILWLIIVESVTITTIFGYIGMVAGIGVTEWMNSAFGNQTMDTGMWTETVFLNPTVDIRIAIQATLTLIIAGTLAGLFPARKAVSIRPIEALRAD